MSYDSTKQQAYRLNADLVDQINYAVKTDNKAEFNLLFGSLHVADKADLLEQIGRSERRQLLNLWGDAIEGLVLLELEQGVRDQILNGLDSRVIKKILKTLDTDEVVNLIEDINPLVQEKLLKLLKYKSKEAIRQALSYQALTAGRLMQREVVTVPEHFNVGNAIDLMRSRDDLPKDFYEIIIVDSKFHPTGVVSLGKLMASKRNVSLLEISSKTCRLIPVSQSQEDVAYAFNQYHMVSAPVINEEGRLVGVINIDDAMNILEDETEEDMKKIVGLGDEELSDSVMEIVLNRFPWLLTNLLTAILASIVIAQFASTIEALVALAVLMPIVASMGGNAGTQTVTVAVRALATRDLTSANSIRVIYRELLVGLLNGCIFSIIMGFIGFIWFQNFYLGVVLGLAMIFNMLIAALSGILLPISLTKAGVDPALSSNVLLTTLTDIVGFFVFLGLASWFLL